MSLSSISEINFLPEDEKFSIYIQVIPVEILQRFNLTQEKLFSDQGNLVKIHAEPGTSSAEISFFHQSPFSDPVLYGQITDTLSGQVHVLMYVLNDPDSPRFDIDRLPDGTPTKYGIMSRNLSEELAAFEFGLAPGQIRRGLRLLPAAITAFEQFVNFLGHEMYFVEPLFYHNAVIFEWNGFGYQKGRRLMESINDGIQPGGVLNSKLDRSTPFRQPQAANNVRLRSWAIHDGILGYPFTDVTMYKRLGAHAGEDTCPGCIW